MQRRGGMLATATLVLILAGCNGNTDQAAVTVTQTVIAEPVAQAPPAVAAQDDTLPDEAAVDLFHEIDFWEGADPDALAEYSEAVCGSYGTGVDPLEIWLTYVKIATDNGMPARDAGASIVYAVGWKCPEFMDLVGP